MYQKMSGPDPERKTRGDAFYRSCYRNLDYYLQRALEGREESDFSIEEIRVLLHEETGFKFHKETIRKYVRYQEDQFGIAPLQEVYRFNPPYYREKNVKPPRRYRPRKK